MKHLILIFGLSFLAITSCNTKTTTNENIISQNPLENDSDMLSDKSENTTDEPDLDNEYILSALEQLGINLNDCKQRYMSESILSYDKSKSVVIIPKISEKLDEEDIIIMDAYILLMDRKTKEIEATYYEKEGWSSSAMKLLSIETDSITYKVNESTYAFGIMLSYSSSSYAYPFSTTQMNLFVSQGDSLKKILIDYPISTYRGEFTLESSYEERVDVNISILKEITNGYYNILAEAKMAEDEGSATEESVFDTDTLRFSGEKYQHHILWNY